MSVSPIWTVWCDVGGTSAPWCQHWCEATGMTSGEARANARAMGWRQRGRLHVCPGCLRHDTNGTPSG